MTPRHSPHTGYLGNVNFEAPPLGPHYTPLPPRPEPVIELCPTLVAYRGYQGSNGFPWYYWDDGVWRDTITNSAWDGRK